MIKLTAALIFFDAQTLLLFVFILKACSEQILGKLINFLVFFFFGVSYGCGFRLFTGPPSTLDYVLSYLFSFI